jgi:hypothetical protein
MTMCAHLGGRSPAPACWRSRLSQVKPAHPGRPTRHSATVYGDSDCRCVTCGRRRGHAGRSKGELRHSRLTAGGADIIRTASSERAMVAAVGRSECVPQPTTPSKSASATSTLNEHVRGCSTGSALERPPFVQRLWWCCHSGSYTRKLPRMSSSAEAGPRVPIQASTPTK